MGKELTSFIKNCKSFCDKYNKKEETEELKRRIASESNVSDLKSLRFAVMYYEIGSALNIKEDKLIKFSEFIAFLSNICHSADDLVDSVLSTGEKIDKVGVLLSYYPTLNVFLKKLALDYGTIQQGFGRGIQLFREENKIIENKKKPSEETTEYLLKIGNPDFFIYNNLFYSLIREDKAKQIDSFMENYVVLDLVLDHITDLDEDFENNSFNPVLWFLKSKTEVDKDNLIKKLISHKTYGSFLEIAFKYGKMALEKSKLSDNKLANVLRTYVKGELEGLNLFKKYNYLVNFQNRIKLTKLILKPHPWEHYSYKEVYD